MSILFVVLLLIQKRQISQPLQLCEFSIFTYVRHACITIQNLFFHSNKFIKTNSLDKHAPNVKELVEKLTNANHAILQDI